MDRIAVRINDPKGGRRVVVCELIKLNASTCWVRLPGGNIIKRKLWRDVPP